VDILVYVLELSFDSGLVNYFAIIAALESLNFVVQVLNIHSHGSQDVFLGNLYSFTLTLEVTNVTDPIFLHLVSRAATATALGA
jgi:hypothetical protein